MSYERRRGERGQVLILAAMLMTSLIAFLALAIDIGNGYAQRRYMQNAADASALAGARHLGHSMASGTSDQAVLDTVNNYLAQNNQAIAVTEDGLSQAWYTDVNGARLRRIGGGSVAPVPGGGTPQVTGVEVMAGRRVDTFFARMMGYRTITVQAKATATYGNAAYQYLNWSRNGGHPMGPLVFDLDAYRASTAAGGCNGYGGYGRALKFSLYVDTPSDCATGPDIHFSYTTLNIDSNCANATVKDVTRRLLYDPESLGGGYIRLNQTHITVCHGSRMSNPELISGVGRPFIVPLISHIDAMACHPSCYPVVRHFAYIRITSHEGGGSNLWYNGYWVDPSTMPPLPGEDVSQEGGWVTGPTAFTLIR